MVITTTAIITSIYFGINFWKPIIIEQLERDGNLRKDIEIDHRNSSITGSQAAEQPKSWQDLRQKINAVIDPEKNFTAEDQKGLQRLRDRLQSSNPNSNSNDNNT